MSPHSLRHLNTWPSPFVALFGEVWVAQSCRKKYVTGVDSEIQKSLPLLVHSLCLVLASQDVDSQHPVPEAVPAAAALPSPNNGLLSPWNQKPK